MRNNETPTIEIGYQTDDKDGNIFFVRDNGIGINPYYHEKVFELFDRLDPNVTGTGVGLSIVKRIIETHNGRIWIESDGNENGTTFYFTLEEQ